MAAKKKTTKKKADGKKADEDGVIRSVRFTADQFAGIKARADKLGLEFSSFCRQAACVAAGLGNGEVKAAERVVAALKSVGKA